MTEAEKVKMASSGSQPTAPSLIVGTSMTLEEKQRKERAQVSSSSLMRIALYVGFLSLFLSLCPHSVSLSHSLPLLSRSRPHLILFWKGTLTPGCDFSLPFPNGSRPLSAKLLFSPSLSLFFCFSFS